MAINLYTGRMGGGKSYEVVANPILNAIKNGRNVATNVAGLNYENIVAYLTKKHPDWNPETAGKITTLTTDELLEQGSLPIYVEDSPAIPGKYVKPGDLLVLDEVWRIWPAGALSEISDEHKSFLRMHRHITRDDGLSSDIICITQHKRDVNRFVLSVVESIFKMTKLTSVGRKNSYRIDIFPGNANPDRAAPDRRIFKNYDAEIFPLYKSFSGGSGEGKEETIDGRTNLLAGGWMIKLGLPLAIIFIVGGIWYTVNFFTDNPLLNNAKNTENTDLVAIGSSNPANLKNDGVIMNTTTTKQKNTGYGNERLVAMYTLNAFTVSVLATPDGRYRYIAVPAEVSRSGPEIEIVDDNVRYAPWSGAAKNSERELN
ncbi:MAG: hypothetical protein OQL06_10015 [Gammaproteobacteria bacterium]|nr:hypothetical protein [Gammaproteobacteria bacterium]